jgi:ATP-binding cassette, subfamily B, bacterial PglK
LAATAAFIALFIIAALMVVDPFAAVVAAVAFSAVYLLVSAFTRPRLARNSDAIRTAYEDRVKIVQESIGGIRDVIVDGSQSMYLRPFSSLSRRYSIATATTAFMAAAPRFIIEAAGMAVIAMVALVIAGRQGGLAGALPVLGAIALGAQRLLPLLQQVYHGWASVSGHSSLLREVLPLLKLPVSAQDDRPSNIQPLPFRSGISVNDVSFAYAERKRSVLDHVTLEIPRGSMVGIVGKTGIGKSTLADLLMGLIEPTHGQIEIDGVPLAGDTRLRWRRSIAHVPQTIFLADASIAQNIAFGVAPNAVDQKRLAAAAELSQLDDFVNSLPDSYSTKVGERGVRLSGGQRQRLGLARAIYKRAPVLILDEATSALDDATEATVLRNLRRLVDNGTTIVMIAHRLSTVAHCDLLVRMENATASIAASCPEIALSSNG